MTSCKRLRDVGGIVESASVAIAPASSALSFPIFASPLTSATASASAASACSATLLMASCVFCASAGPDMGILLRAWLEFRTIAGRGRASSPAPEGHYSAVCHPYFFPLGFAHAWNLPLRGVRGRSASVRPLPPLDRADPAPIASARSTAAPGRALAPRRAPSSALSHLERHPGGERRRHGPLHLSSTSHLLPFDRLQTGRNARNHAINACGSQPVIGCLPVLRTSAGRRSSFAIGVPFSQACIQPFSLGRHPGGERRRRGLPCPLPASLLASAAR